MSIRIIIDITEANEAQERSSVSFKSYFINNVTQDEKDYQQRIFNFIKNDFSRDGDQMIRKIKNER